MLSKFHQMHFIYKGCLTKITRKQRKQRKYNNVTINVLCTQKVTYVYVNNVTVDHCKRLFK